MDSTVNGPPKLYILRSAAFLESHVLLYHSGKDLENHNFDHSVQVRGLWLNHILCISLPIILTIIGLCNAVIRSKYKLCSIVVLLVRPPDRTRSAV